MAPAGEYQLVIRALHIFGDREDPEQYDRVDTVPFTIRYT